MPIKRLEELTYGVEDIEPCTRYFADLGLEALDRGQTGADFRTLENQIVRIRGTGDPGLPPAIEPGSTLRQAVWGVDDAAGLERIGAELSKDRDVRAGADGTLQTRDESGNPIAFREWRCTPVQSASPLVNVGNSAPRLNNPLPRPERIRPIRIVHVVYGLPREGREKAADFYTERLKFRISDRSLDAGDFLRCEGATDHHNLFLLHRVNHLAYNHIALEVRDFDEMIVAGLHLKKQGWKAARQPGRHFLGSNLEWFFESPCGGRVELLADMDRMDDNWKPRIWEKHPGAPVWLLDG